MGNIIVGSWDAIMDARFNPLRHFDLHLQHYFMQVLGWMWSMVFSLMFLSIYHFSITWMLHILFIGGVTMTVMLFREAEKRQAQVCAQESYSAASRCVWKLDSEA